MAAIGSVFLGDVQRHRLLSSGSTPGSTPPSSPPPSITATSSFPHPPRTQVPDASSSKASDTFQLPPTVTPEQSIDLRLRWLEALLHGVKHDPDKRAELRNGDTLMRNAEEVKRRMDDVVEANEGLRRFISHYDQHAQLLTPAFALSGTLPAPPAYQNMSASELEAFLAELEPDIRAADRDMREIEMLEAKGVTAAGKLPDYEALQPRLEALVKHHQEDLETASALERRVAKIIQRYATQVDTLSDLFMVWDDTLKDTDDKISRLEKDREERERLGYI
ncbi:hypothetical protein FA95DRAFT_1493574 [Auriscalpium vulgare]|uniref:Uncharacterized protein n=1 Tax=Auriscalpium vulgare TaxID=40419 RepID=A0ACB8RSX4_9AGAM|nr:hypothetical protein FA95DRAFT_1493574 [Auriscalpium vulgare]